MRRPAAAVLSAALLLGACTSDDTSTTAATDPPEGSTTSRSSTVDTLVAEVDADEVLDGREVDLSATLTGEAEVPGPGDDGSGSFTGTLGPAEGPGGTATQLCYELEVRGLSMQAAAAHVHRGAADEAGEVVVELQAPDDGRATGCVDLRPGDAARIIADPASHYVNVHTDDYPDGAVRGQLVADG